MGLFLFWHWWLTSTVHPEHDARTETPLTKVDVDVVESQSVITVGIFSRNI